MLSAPSLSTKLEQPQSLAPGTLPAIVAANNGEGSVSVLLNQTPAVANRTISLQEDTTTGITLTGSGSGTLTYVLVSGPTNGVLLTNSVAINPSAYPVALRFGLVNVIYRPDTNFFGADSFTYQAVHGNVTSAVAKVSLTISSVNDAPTFTLNTNLLGAVNEDTALVTVSGFASNISAGPANESTQTVSFVLKTTNTAFFATTPKIDAAGTLTFKPKGDSNGVQWVSVYAQDSVRTPCSSTQTFAIVVSPMNDRPTVSTIMSRSAYEDRATNISFTVGDIDNALNSLTVTATSSDTSIVPNTSLVLGGSGASRTLMVTPTANKIGFTDITVNVSDGALSTNRVFRLTFLPVNDAPEFSLTGTNIAVAVNSATTNITGWATGIRPGPIAATDEAAQRVSFVVTNNNSALFAVQPALATNGVLSFRPASNVVGRATVTVRAKDTGNTLFGGTNQSAAQTFTIEVMAVPFSAGDLVVADRGPAGVGTSVYGSTMGGALFLVNPTNGTQTLLTTNIIDPTGLALAPDGDIFVADYDAVLADPINNRGVIYRMSRYNLAVTTVSSGGNFAEPFALAVETDGNILVADADAFSLAGAIFRVNPTNGTQTTLSTGGYFKHLAGLSLAGSGTIYVTDRGDGGANLPKIVSINPVSGAQSVVSEGGALQAPAGLAVEPGTGDLIVVDSAALLVLRINTGTGVQTVISTGGYFVEPSGVAIEAGGNFIVTEGRAGTTAAERRVYRVDKNTGAQTVISSGGALEQPRGVLIAR